MSTLSEIRGALAASLAALPEEVKISLTGGKYDEHTERFAVRVLVGEPSEDAEERLDELLAPDGSHSICALLESDPQLGGTVSALRVLSHSGHLGFQRPDGPPELGSEVTVEVYR